MYRRLNSFVISGSWFRDVAEQLEERHAQRRSLSASTVKDTSQSLTTYWSMREPTPTNDRTLAMSAERLSVVRTISETTSTFTRRTSHSSASSAARDSVSQELSWCIVPLTTLPVTLTEIKLLRTSTFKLQRRIRDSLLFCRTSPTASTWHRWHPRRSLQTERIWILPSRYNYIGFRSGSHSIVLFTQPNWTVYFAFVTPRFCLSLEL